MRHKPLSKKIRQLVYDKYDGHCAYCGCKLEYKDMQVDHINSLYRAYIKGQKDTVIQDDNLDNLMPSCRMCNYYKQEGSIEELRQSLQEVLMRNVRRPFDYRLALKYELIKENIHPIKFYFENICQKKK